MSAAERASEMAEQGAAEARAEQGTKWQYDGVPKPMPTWLRAEIGLSAWCRERGPGGGFGCTRRPGHPGRHIATGIDEVYTAWPGAHEPIGGDLTTRGDQPPALVLPDGWEQYIDCYRWQPEDADALDIEADPTDAVCVGDVYYEPPEARALAARLVEAAAIVEQLRGGAR